MQQELTLYAVTVPADAVIEETVAVRASEAVQRFLAGRGGRYLVNGGWNAAAADGYVLCRVEMVVKAREPVL